MLVGLYNRFYLDGFSLTLFIAVLDAVLGFYDSEADDKFRVLASCSLSLAVELRSESIIELLPFLSSVTITGSVCTL